MKKLKVLFFGKAHLKDSIYTTVDDDIKFSLEKMGHKVVFINDENFDTKDVIKRGNECDLFFFRTGGIVADSMLNFQLSLTTLQAILNNIKCKKVFWFDDKVWGLNEGLMSEIIPLVDYGFLNDDTWIRRHKYPNVFPLHSGFSERYNYLGNYQKEYDVDIALIGNIYGARRVLVEKLKNIFGDKFKIYNDVFGRNFYNLCESAKIIVSPNFPFDDFYWSDRPYSVLGARGFLLHPRLEGLKTHLQDGKHFVSYGSFEELVERIKFWLDPKHSEERSSVAQNGRNCVLQKHTYSNRLKELLEIIQK